MIATTGGLWNITGNWQGGVVATAPPTRPSSLKAAGGGTSYVIHRRQHVYRADQSRRRHPVRHPRIERRDAYAPGRHRNFSPSAGYTIASLSAELPAISPPPWSAPAPT